MYDPMREHIKYRVEFNRRLIAQKRKARESMPNLTVICVVSISALLFALRWQV